MRESLIITERILGDRHADVAGCLRNLAGLFQSRAQYEEAVTTYSRALSIYREKWGNLHIDVALTCNDLAVLYMRMGQPSAAEALYADALAAYVDHFGEEHADTALATLNLAECVATQVIARGQGAGVDALLTRAVSLFTLARHRFSFMRVGAVSGAGAVGVTKEKRMAHCDESLRRLRQIIDRQPQNKK